VRVILKLGKKQVVIEKSWSRHTQAGAWQQYDNNDESRSREGVGGFLVDFPRPIIGYLEYL